MKRFIVSCAAVALSLQAVSLPTCVEAATTGPKQSLAAAARDAAVAARLESLAKFVAVGDAASLAGLWAEDGAYIDASGNSYQGRDALQKRFATMFARGEKPTLSLNQTKTQVLAPNVVVSEGTVVRKLPAGDSVIDTRYAFVFTKKGRDWFISAATETPVVQDGDDVGAPAKVALDNLSWMVGDWAAQRDGQTLKLHIDWTSNKNFLRWTYSISKAGEAPQDNTEVIAYDAKAGGLVSYSFDANGAFGQSEWTGDSSQWQVECIKTARDGSTLTARHIITPKGVNEFTWQSIDRTEGGLPLPDTGELQITRQK